MDAKFDVVVEQKVVKEVRIKVRDLFAAAGLTTDDVYIESVEAPRGFITPEAHSLPSTLVLRYREKRG
jgi:hypothetical protein